MRRVSHSIGRLSSRTPMLAAVGSSSMLTAARSIVVNTGAGGNNKGPSTGSESPSDTTTTTTSSTPVKVAGESQIMETHERYDHGPRRQTGLWSVKEVEDSELKTVDFRRIDEIESDIIEDQQNRDQALVLMEDENKWKNKLMFDYKFKKTPKHLTWAEFGKEIGCIDCVIDLDEDRPEEVFTMTWYYVDEERGTRDEIWKARNDVAVADAFVDLLAAIGSCLGRPDVHRTLRFDDGLGTTRELNLRKNSRYTSEIVLAFRPSEKYNMYDRKYERDAKEKEAEDQGLSTWGFHPDLLDPEYRDLEDPEGTYHITLSAHAFCFVMLSALERFTTQPLKNYYRPSQRISRAQVKTTEHIGVSTAVWGWLGAEEQTYVHLTPIEAIQDHFLGNDAPFTIVQIMNKLREMCYLKKRNPEFQSWLSVRRDETTTAIRNVRVKMLGAGASTLFLPKTHNSTINQLLPKGQQRRINTRVSVNAVLGMPDEVRKIDQFKQITGHARITSGESAVRSSRSKIDETEVKKEEEEPKTTAPSS